MTYTDAEKLKLLTAAFPCHGDGSGTLAWGCATLVPSSTWSEVYSESYGSEGAAFSDPWGISPHLMAYPACFNCSPTGYTYQLIPYMTTYLVKRPGNVDVPPLKAGTLEINGYVFDMQDSNAYWKDNGCGIGIAEPQQAGVYELNGRRSWSNTQVLKNDFGNDAYIEHLPDIIIYNGESVKNVTVEYTTPDYGVNADWDAFYCVIGGSANTPASPITLEVTMMQEIIETPDTVTTAQTALFDRYLAGKITAATLKTSYAQSFPSNFGMCCEMPVSLLIAVDPFATPIPEPVITICKTDYRGIYPLKHPAVFTGYRGIRI